MDFKKRAIKSITRRKGKSLILFAVLFILGNLIAGAISIQQATGNVEESIKNRLGAKATFEMDFMKYAKENQDNYSVPEGPSLKMIKDAGKLSYVKKYDYNVKTIMATDKMKTFQPETDDNTNAVIMGDDATVTLKGVNYAPLLDLEEKKAKLVDGRAFTQSEVDEGKPIAIISKKYAELNNLNVGDKMVIDNTVYSYNQKGERSETPDATKDLALDIIGIFEPTQAKKSENSEGEDYTKSLMKEFYQSAYQNTIYVPNKISIEESNFITNESGKAEGLSDKEIQEQTRLNAMYSPVYILKSPEAAEAFKEEMSPLMPKYYNVKASTDQYDSIAGPIKSMSKLSQYVLIASVGAAIFIISLIILLFLRDRKHELGIYLSLGEKRLQIISQILIEVMLVAIVAITLSVFSGNFLAKGVSSSMMQANTEQKASGDQAFSIGISEEDLSSDVTTSDVKNAYQINLSLNFVIVFYLVGLCTILLSTVIPLLYILKLNPKKIMM